MSIAHLAERSVLSVTGEDAATFLNGLLTCQIAGLEPPRAAYGALLSPQGKILCDMIVVPLTADDGGGFLIDLPKALAPGIAKRLTMYKLRAKVTLSDLTETAAVVAHVEGGRIPAEAGIVYADPRLAAMGDRAIVDRDDLVAWTGASEDDYLIHRIAMGLPEGGKDFGYEMTFPHEANMDQLGGVSFTKGCYVGQEVVSRMEHRGTARTRIVPIRFLDGIRSEWGVGVEAGGKAIGDVGSTADGRGLAMLRLDRLADALAEGHTVVAGGLPVAVEKPSYARFLFPGDAGFGEAKA
jgi:hypothetical protein